MNEITWSELLYLWEATDAVPDASARTCQASVRKSVAAALWREADGRPTAAERQHAAAALENSRVPRRRESAQQDGAGEITIRIQVKGTDELVTFSGQLMPMGFSEPADPVPPGTEVEVRATALYDLVMMKWLFVGGPGSTANAFDLIDLRIGEDSLLVTATGEPIPLSTFAAEEAALDFQPHLHLRLCNAGTEVVVTLKNVSDAPARASGSVLCVCSQRERLD